MAFFRRGGSQAKNSTLQVLMAGHRLQSRGRVRLRSPILVAAFEGWNDAGESASYAVRYLERAWSALPLGEIDGEEFFDFTSVRPESVVGEDKRRRIIWPSTSLLLASSPEFEHDVILLRGPEPQLRWRTYCDVLVEFMRAVRVEQVVTLGAYLSEVTHRRPVAVNVTSASARAALREESGSSYEGPTGIVGVLSAALLAAGIENVSAWASVPCYSFPVSQKAALALVEAIGHIVDRPVDTAELQGEAEEYETRMDELVSDDENIAAYVARIEEMEDASGTELSSEGLTDEIERYLRGRRSS